MRPANEFKLRMQELANREESETYLSDCLDGKYGPKAFMAARRHVVEYAYGKPPQPIEAEDRRPLEVIVTRRITHPER